MLLFQKRFHQGLLDGSITLTVRRWARPHVKPNGRYRVHPIGVVQVDAVSTVREAELTPTDARASGFESLDELKTWLKPGAHPLYRVELHHEGDGDHVDSAMDDALTPAALAQLEQQLGRLEKHGRWVKRVLRLIARHPRVAASKLAQKLGRQTQPFKVDVRKLKRLGLTMSFEVGYELSPRGKRYLALGPKRRSKPAPAAGAGRALSGATGA